MALEEAANTAEVETHSVDDDAPLPQDLRPGSVMSALYGKRKAHSGALEGREAASEIAKLRRDIKNCYEQHPKAVACGDVPLVRIPILGRAVRIFDEWHALCSFCGCLARIHPTSRFRADPCCMRCDFAMLHGKEAAKAMSALLPKPPAPACRYCGRCAPKRIEQNTPQQTLVGVVAWWQEATRRRQRPLEDDPGPSRHGRAQRCHPATAARRSVRHSHSNPALAESRKHAVVVVRMNSKAIALSIGGRG